MNNEKIGKFIAKLRKAKGLTQQQLGDLVGVGGKSVSKWERGLNMPDISIINEVSKILGITSDELLKGEFDRKSTNEEYKRKKNKRNTIIILIMLIILTIIVTACLIFYFRNDVHRYWISSANQDYNVDGSIEYDKNGYIITIDNIYCNLDECSKIYINNIQISMLINGIMMYRKDYFEYTNSAIKLNECLDKKDIFLDEKYDNSSISYSWLKNNITSSILSIEIVDSINELHKYDIPLRIDDKES